MSVVVEGLKYRYPGGKKLALDDVTFTVKEGEMVGVIGCGSAGKTSLCLALSGFIPHFFQGAYGGNVQIDGMDIRDASLGDWSSKAGIVLDRPEVQLSGTAYTVYDELAFGLENMGMERGEMLHRIDDALREFGLEAVRNQFPYHLSGGMMQKAALASVAIMRPSVLILDEPTSQLDPAGTEQVFEVIHSLKKAGMTIIMAEKKMEQLAEYADRIILLHEGRLVDDNIPAAVFSRDDLESYGVEPPVFTTAARMLGRREPETGYYPATLASMMNVMRGDWK